MNQGKLALTCAYKGDSRIKYNLSAERVQEEADKINQEFGRFDPARRHLVQMEISNQILTFWRVLYIICM